MTWPGFRQHDPQGLSFCTSLLGEIPGITCLRAGMKRIKVLPEEVLRNFNLIERSNNCSLALFTGYG
jgi:hypothetical protein